MLLFPSVLGGGSNSKPILLYKVDWVCSIGFISSFWLFNLLIIDHNSHCIFSFPTYPVSSNHLWIYLLLYFIPINLWLASKINLVVSLLGIRSFLSLFFFFFFFCSGLLLIRSESSLRESPRRRIYIYIWVVIIDYCGLKSRYFADSHNL